MAPGTMGANWPATSTPLPRSRSTEITPPMASRPKTEPPESTSASTRSTVMSASSRWASRRPGAPPETAMEAVAGASNSSAVTPVAIFSSWALPTSTPGTSVMRLRMDTLDCRVVSLSCAMAYEGGKTKEFDMTDNVTISAALLAGLLSFLSPCVLPLVPPYLTFIAGTTLEELVEGGERRARRDVAVRRAAVRAGLFHRVRRARRHGVRHRPDRARKSAAAVDRPPASSSSAWACISSASSSSACSIARSALDRGKAGRPLGRLCDGPRLRLRLDALHRADPRRHSGGGRRRRRRWARAHSLLAVYSLGLGIPFLARGARDGAVHALHAPLQGAFRQGREAWSARCWC